MNKYKRVFSMFHLTRPVFLIDVQFSDSEFNFSTNLELAKDVDKTTEEEKQYILSKGYDILNVRL